MREVISREFTEIISFVKDFQYEFINELNEAETIESLERVIELQMNIFRLSLECQFKKMTENVVKAVREWKNNQKKEEKSLVRDDMMCDLTDLSK